MTLHPLPASGRSPSYGNVVVLSQILNQPGKVPNPARGQLNRENVYFSWPRPHLRI